MRGKLSWTLAFCAVVALASLPLAAGEKATVTGEVVDSACYIKMGAKGAAHQECAVKCAEAGIPLAILEDGTEKVIWVAAAQDVKSANDALTQYAAQKVTVTGSWAERGGTKLLVIESVKPAA